MFNDAYAIIEWNLLAKKLPSYTSKYVEFNSSGTTNYSKRIAGCLSDKRHLQHSYDQSYEISPNRGDRTIGVKLLGVDRRMLSPKSPLNSQNETVKQLAGRNLFLGIVTANAADVVDTAVKAGKFKTLV